MAFPRPIHLVCRRKAVDLAMTEHQVPRKEARRIIGKVRADQVDDCCDKSGLVMPKGGWPKDDPTPTPTPDPAPAKGGFIQWLKDHWEIILKIALAILGIAMMFASPAIIKQIANFKASNPGFVFPKLSEEPPHPDEW